MFKIFSPQLEPQIIGRIPAEKLSWRRDALLVWIPNSNGQLRYVYGCDNHNEPKGFLLLNDVPLIKIHANECPTCDQLLQAGYGLDKVDKNVVDQIECYENLCGLDEDTFIESLNPILMMLESGLYLFSNILYYPTDGQGNCFWTISNKPKISSGLAQSWEAQEIPSFLIPTQPVSKIDYERIDYYRRKLKNGEKLGGIAYYIEGYMSAILDGHHRTMASLLERKPIDCITISRVHAVSVGDKRGQLKTIWACGQSIDASTLPTSISRKITKGFNNIKIINVSEVNNYLNMQSEEWEDVCFDNEVIDAARSFPSISGIVSISLAGELTDERIDKIFQGNEFNEEDIENMKHIFNAMIALNDHRTYELGYKIASSDRWVSLWDESYKYLSRFRNNEIENLFIDFLINDEENRRHIKKIIDDYFREAKNGV